MVCTTTNIKKIDHIVLTSAKPKECLAFYETLGFRVEDMGVRYELFAGDFKINVHILGKELQPNAHLAQPGTLDLCMEVHEDLYAYRNALLAKGIEVTQINEKHGVHGVMQSFYLRDPDLNLLEFCSYR